jgi:hypothetical protein
VLLLLLLRLSRPVYLAFRRQHSGYGVVFNSITGLPEPLVSVRLVTPGTHRRIVSTAITDRHGRYRLTAKPGEYRVEVVKEGVVFPSRYLKQKSALYTDLLSAARVVIKEYGIMTKNIAVDPVAPSTKRSKAFRPHVQLGSATQYFLAYGTPFLLVLLPIAWDSRVAWALFWWYVVVVLHRMFTYKPPQPRFGTVRNAATREPVERAIVRIFGTKFDKLMETQITGPRGRYAFVVRPGSYYITISKPGYRTVRFNFPNIPQDGYALAKDVEMTRLGEHGTYGRAPLAHFSPFA